MKAPVPALVVPWEGEGVALLTRLARGPLGCDAVLHDALLGQELEVQLPPPEREVLENIQVYRLWHKLVPSVLDCHARRLRAQTNRQHAASPGVRVHVLRVNHFQATRFRPFAVQSRWQRSER